PRSSSAATCPGTASTTTRAPSCSPASTTTSATTSSTATPNGSWGCPGTGGGRDPRPTTGGVNRMGLHDRLAATTTCYLPYPLEDALRGIADAGFRHVELAAIRGV